MLTKQTHTATRYQPGFPSGRPCRPTSCRVTPSITRASALPPAAALQVSDMANTATPGPLQTAVRAVAGIASNGPLAVSLAVPLALGSLAGAATLKPILTWYQRLRKPRWTPPAPIIGNTWSVLYSCMGAASYLVWKKTGLGSAPMVLYATQLGLNVAWQLIFFRGRAVETAQKENAVLLAAVAATTVSFWRVDPAAGKLMLPYLAFTGFANALNYSILKKNPEEMDKEEERHRE